MQNAEHSSVEESGLKARIRKKRRVWTELMTRRVVRVYNRIRVDSKHIPETDLSEFGEVLSHAQTPTDIGDHLKRLFSESLLVDPETIVELGVRGGESNFVFERVSQLTGADVVSVDIEDCSTVADFQGWHFVESDDIEFAHEFEDWCGRNGVSPDIDILFIDTSHVYDHTADEIESWFPHLSERAIVFFHDTNLSEYYRREDGSVGVGWDNDRGVIRAIEEHFDCSLNEKERFTTIQSQFVIKHLPHSNGLTVLYKIPSLQDREK